ncbi:MAG: metallophosphoesterase [Clostridia bacterium]|nr:metallophosphoesterase [Clostridia bacterium]
MALFVLSDPHLAIAHAEKSMEAFGSRWQNYVERIEKNWRAVVSEGDTVILPGDISWGMTLDDARDDFAFLDTLPGQKLIGKGNHDFFWSTAAKMTRFFEDNGFSTLRILYNNAYMIEHMIVCGTRGWFLDEKQQRTVGEVDYEKIVNREAGRLRLSLDAARAQQAEHGMLEIIPFLHFPPAFGEFRCPQMMHILSEYGVRRCYYGHIHAPVAPSAPVEIDGIRYILCAADHLRFTPLPVFPTETLFGV